MARKNPILRWDLPEVIDPDDSVCFTVPVPNDVRHIGAFMGAIFLLTKPYAWANDPDHKALEVAAVWRAIFDNLERCMPENWTVRLNPDDCTEVQQFDDTTMDFIDVFSIRCAIDTVIGETFPESNPPLPGQPGEQPGGPAPEPGECWELKFPVTPNGSTLIPLPIDDDWTILPLALEGASTDGRFGPANTWVCANGNRFALGACAGTSYTDSNDPSPSDPHMGVLLARPDGTYTFLQVGTTITIPSGSTPGNYQLIVNNNTVTLPPPVFPFLPFGDLTVQLQICNSNSFHLYDFSVDDGGFAVDNTPATQSPAPVWLTGDAWASNGPQTANLPNTELWCFIAKTLSSTFRMVRLEMVYSLSAAGQPGSQQQVGVDNFSDAHRAVVTSPPSGTHTLIYQPAGGLITDRIYGVATYSDFGLTGAVVKIHSIKVFYTGTPPTW